jgi:RNA polymerase sigma factor (sigma-70 family)
VTKARDFPPDDELLNRIRAEDEEANYLLHEKHSRAVDTIIWVKLREPWCNHQEDVRSETWNRVFRHLSTLRDPSRLEPFIRKIAINESFRHLRNAHMGQPETEPLDETQQSELGGIISVEKMAEDAELFDKALTAVEAELPKFGEIIKLHQVEGYVFEEIGDRLGWTKQKVWRTYQRGVKRLLKLLEGGCRPTRRPPAG